MKVIYRAPIEPATSPWTVLEVLIDVHGLHDGEHVCLEYLRESGEPVRRLMSLPELFRTTRRALPEEYRAVLDRTNDRFIQPLEVL